MYTATCENLNETYLNIISNFWNKSYEKLTNENILSLSTVIWHYSINQKKFHIEDLNVDESGAKLVKIYIRKTYQNLLELIKNIEVL